MDNNRVNVKIFGQDYTITGNKSREHIMKVADYVDVKMKEISQALHSGPVSAIAVLAAVNVSDDYFSAIERFQHLEVNNAQSEKEINHYIGLWEEAKKSHVQLQDDLKEMTALRDELQNKVADQKEILQKELLKQQEELHKELMRQQEEMQSLISEKDAELKKLKEERLKIEGQIMESSSDMVNELEAKYKDLESSFFDIQMENIQLKGELDRYKKKME